MQYQNNFTFQQPHSPLASAAVNGLDLSQCYEGVLLSIGKVYFLCHGHFFVGLSVKFQTEM